MTTLIPKFDIKDGGATPTGAVNRPINEKLSDVVSVKDFGAIGDATTDDTTAIQNAIAYAQSLTYGTVYFPQGKYKTTASLTVTRPISFVGDGSFASQILPTSAVTTPCLNWGVIGDTPRPGYAIVIEKLAFIGDATVNANSHGIYLWAGHTEIKDCIIENFAGSGVYATNSWDNIINHCWFHANKVNNISLNEACNMFVISNNYILDSLADGILVTGGNKIVIENNDIEGNHHSGVWLYNNAAVNPIRSCAIRDNYFENNNIDGGYSNINIQRSGGEISSLSVTSNYIETANGSAGVYVNGVNGGVIENNICAGGYAYYPAAEGENIYSFNDQPATTLLMRNDVYSPNTYANRDEGLVVTGRVSRFAVNTQEGFEASSGTLWSVSGRYASSPFPTITIGTNTQSFGTTYPTTGNHYQGDIVWCTNPGAGGNIGWVCVTTGTPGTWKTFGAIAA